MEAVIRKWGNSPALRLPAALMKAAAMRVEQKVRMTVVRGRIVIEPTETVEYDLESLVQGIKASHAHGEIDMGRPVGKEAF